jgi:hypothetical protein
MCLGEVLTIPRTKNSDSAASCICGNEHSDSINCGEFLDYVKTSLFLKKDSAQWSYLDGVLDGGKYYLYVPAIEVQPSRPQSQLLPGFPFSHLNNKQSKLLFLSVNFLKYFKLCVAHKRFRIFASICALFYSNSE